MIRRQPATAPSTPLAPKTAHSRSEPPRPSKDEAAYSPSGDNIQSPPSQATLPRHQYFSTKCLAEGQKICLGLHLQCNISGRHPRRSLWLICRAASCATIMAHRKGSSLGVVCRALKRSPVMDALDLNCQCWHVYIHDSLWLHACNSLGFLFAGLGHWVYSGGPRLIDMA
jgi:hypothetical protein